MSHVRLLLCAASVLAASFLLNTRTLAEETTPACPPGAACPVKDAGNCATCPHHTVDNKDCASCPAKDEAACEGKDKAACDASAECARCPGKDTAACADCEHAATQPAASADDANAVPYYAAPYPLTTCLVSGEPLGEMGDPITVDFRGQKIQLCCPHCEEALNKDPKKYIRALNEAVIAQQKPYYPLTTCIVSGDELEDDAVEYVYENRLYRLCCAMCVSAFRKDPAKYAQALTDAVVAKQAADYPLSTCPATGRTLDATNTVNTVVGDRLVRVCGKGCASHLGEEPAKFLQLLDDAIEQQAAAQQSQESAETANP
jgi:YHS domain-containing protein